ncbi:MAG TPA: serine/threonine-protein kinase [Gemmatimonadales bacterium]|nr:serine/threonine-protein kinase [Gemmatimonadales bacterium]
MDIRPDWTEALADRYRIEKEIGRGGMASVYLAEDLRYRRKVAIKVLRTELAHALAHDRFLEEIRTAARLNHPGIVPVYDSGLIPAAPGRPALPWFAMMFIAGESLKERLVGGPLPVADAVDIARAVAAALDYAHREQVIHRDIKPGNILLAADAAVVADFGIARAVDRAGDDSFTATGLTVGTPHYISPEQASAEPTLDHRTDVYALGCVVYEMLAGQPPFTGPNPQAIVARHNLDPPPSLTTVRPGIPPGTVMAIEKALAKRPEDRWTSAGAFAHALRETTEHPAATAPIPMWHRAWWSRRRVAGAAAGALVVAAGVLLWRIIIAPGSPAPDPDRYLVLVQDSDRSQVATMLIVAALERWEGATVLLLEEPAASAPTAGAAGAERWWGSRVQEAAIRRRAGRLLFPALAASGDSALLRLTLWDTGDGRRLGSAEGRISATGQVVASARVTALVDSLVAAQYGGGGGCSLAAGPAALVAMRLLHRGDSLMGEWQLRAAADTLAAAAAADPSLGAAAVCHALVVSWIETGDLLWGGITDRLASGASRLGPRDQRLLEALASRQAGDYLRACAGWRDLAGQAPEDFAAQYGLADCLANDTGVLRDRISRTGWRFRAEYGEARAAYRRAVALNPAIYRALAPGEESAARHLFGVKPSVARFGVALAPDTGTFNAWATLEGDTLASVPVRTLAFATSDPAAAPPPGTVAAAVARKHEMLYRLIAAWRTVRPAEVVALAALAEALEVRGDRTALDTLRLARRLTPDSAMRYRIAAAESFLMVRMAAPGSPGMLRDATKLADSLLGVELPEPSLAFERAGLAALRGRGLMAAANWREPELTRRLQVPPYLKGIAPALLVFSAMGGPVDSIRELEAQVEAAIRRQFSDADPANERMRWLALPATIAWPSYAFATLPNLRAGGDPILDAVVAAIAHDSTAVRRSLKPYWDGRAKKGSQAVTLDGVRTEAELRWDAGEREEALELLDDTLGTLFGLGPGGLQDPLQAAGLVRAAALRARFAAARGDSAGARRWAGVVSLLWSDPEPSALEVVKDALALVTRGAR